MTPRNIRNHLRIDTKMAVVAQISKHYLLPLIYIKLFISFTFFKASRNPTFHSQNAIFEGREKIEKRDFFRLNVLTQKRKLRKIGSPERGRERGGGRNGEKEIERKNVRGRGMERERLRERERERRKGKERDVMVEAERGKG